MDSIQSIIDSFKTEKLVCVLLSSLSLFFGWIYIPTILQIVINSQGYSPTGDLFSSPLRIFIPIFPFLNPSTIKGQLSPAFEYIDTIYAWNVGWTFLIFFATIFLSTTWRNRLKAIPFVFAIAFASVAYVNPIFHLMPMFKCSRVAERISFALLPVFLSPLCFLSVTAWKQFKKNHKIALLLTSGLFAVEFSTAYSSTFLWAYDNKSTPFSFDYQAAINLISVSHQKAIFFWPSSPHGGDGRGYSPFEHISCGSMQFAARCHKKTNECYFGRMNEKDLEEFFSFGWPKIFESTRPLDKHTWDRVKSHLSTNDFAYLLVSPELIQPSLHKDILANLGTPVLTVSIPCSNNSHKWEIIPINSSCMASPTTR